MKIIQVLILMLLCLDFQSVKANSTYVWGDTLHVWATSGLNMREGPGTDFPKMKKLEYGDKVQVIDDYLRSTPLNITVVKKSKESDAFVMKGHWVRVIIGSQEGYVFDGYLSRLPVFKIVTNPKYEILKRYTISEGTSFYVERNFSKIEETEVGDRENGEEDFTHTIHYEKDIEYFTGGNKACGWEGLNIKNISLNEAFLFLSVAYQLDFQIKKYPSFEFKLEKNKKGEIQILLLSGDSEDVNFEFKNNSVSIYSEGCC
jgi:hypothetical protein